MLLHCAASSIQDMFYSLIKDKDVSYDESVKLLDDYFLPERNLLCERHEFRRLGQTIDESVDQFVCRLRREASSSEFKNEDNECNLRSRH